jgi:hypothetical protein
VGDVCSRSLITIKFHDLDGDTIRGVVGEITSYTMRKTSFVPSLVFAGSMSFGISLAFPFVLHVMVLIIHFYWIFLLVVEKISSYQ